MGEKKTILIVEDEPDIREYISTFLEDNGYSTITAPDGQEGLQKARTEKPDLICLDIMMPKQSGTDFYRKLTKDEELGKIPIVVVSGAAGKHLAVPKPAAIIDKPVDTQKLLDTLSQLLSAKP
jgi:CheY-like chemotaxis protein